MDGRTLKRALTLISVIAVTTTIHELFHLCVGRLVGLPAEFLTFTSVGISESDKTIYPGFKLALMNGVAPILSVILFGALPFLLLKKEFFRKSMLSEILRWSLLFNLPYLGLQLLLAVNVSSANGSGTDSAAVLEALHASKGLRFFLGSIGYPIFYYTLFLASQCFSESPRDIRLSFLSFIKNGAFHRNGPGVLFFGLGFLSVMAGDKIILEGNQGVGMLLIALVGFLSLGIGSTLIIFRQINNYSQFLKDWVFPCALGTILMIPIGVLGNNDYSNFWLILIPSILGITVFSSGIKATPSHPQFVFERQPSPSP